jgi:hypothetical protein
MEWRAGRNRSDSARYPTRVLLTLGKFDLKRTKHMGKRRDECAMFCVGDSPCLGADPSDALRDEKAFGGWIGGSQGGGY